MWLGKLTMLDMTPLGWQGRKNSTQTKAPGKSSLKNEKKGKTKKILTLLISAWNMSWVRISIISASDKYHNILFTWRNKKNKYLYTYLELCMFTFRIKWSDVSDINCAYVVRLANWSWKDNRLSVLPLWSISNHWRFGHNFTCLSMTLTICCTLLYVFGQTGLSKHRKRGISSGSTLTHPAIFRHSSG